MDRYGRYASDGTVLAAIGTALRGQPTGGPIRIPRDLADAAVAAWSRDELNEPADPRSEEQKRVRCQAAALPLIGLSIQERSEAGCDAVLVSLDPDLIAEAVAAGQARAG
jgi:hypothetical protein